MNILSVFLSNIGSGNGCKQGEGISLFLEGYGGAVVNGDIKTSLNINFSIILEKI